MTTLITIREKIKNIDKIIEKENESANLLKEIEGTVKELKNIYQHT